MKRVRNEKTTGVGAITVYHMDRVVGVRTIGIAVAATAIEMKFGRPAVARRLREARGQLAQLSELAAMGAQ